MVPYRVNLIRTVVLPPARRVLLFRAMLGYLALCLLVLAAEVAVGYQRVEDWWLQRAEIRELEARFQAENPGRGELLPCFRRLRERLETKAARLERVSQVLARRFPVGPVVDALLTPLPDDFELATLELDVAKRQVGFDLFVPVAAEAATLSAGELVHGWSGDPALAARLRAVEPLATQRRLIDGQAVFIFKYSAALAEGAP